MDITERRLKISKRRKIIEEVKLERENTSGSKQNIIFANDI
jgi:hypothetical protein